MVKDRISIQRDKKGGWFVVVDGAVKECQSFGEALDIFRSETGDAASSRKWDELQGENARLKKSLDSAAKEFEQLREALEKEKAEKNKWILEAYDWKDTVTKLGKHIARTCG